MATQSQVLEKVQGIAAKSKDTDHGPQNADGEEEYAARLSKTLQSLQNQVKQHEAALEKVSSRITQMIISLFC